MKSSLPRHCSKQRLTRRRAAGTGISCVYSRGIHARLAQGAGRLCALPVSSGQGAGPVPEPVTAWNAGSCCQHFNYLGTDDPRTEICGHEEPYALPPCRWNLVLQNSIPVAGDSMPSSQEQHPRIIKFHFKPYGNISQTLIKWNLVFSTEFNFTSGI